MFTMVDIRLGFVNVRCERTLCIGFAIGLLWCACGVGWWSTAHANTSYQEGRKHYQNYEFQKATQALRQALQETAQPLTQAQRLETLLFLTVSTYNLAQIKAAEAWYQKALALDANARLPKDQAPNVHEHFAKVRARWQAKQLPSVRRRAAVVARRSAAVNQRRAALVVRRSAPQPAARPSPGFWQRQAISLALLGGALVAGGVGIGFGVAFQGQLATYQQQLDKRASHSGAEIEQIHSQAATSGLASTILSISAGALATAGIIAFIVIETRPRPTHFTPSVASSAPPAKTSFVWSLDL